MKASVRLRKEVWDVVFEEGIRRSLSEHRHVSMGDIVTEALVATGLVSAPVVRRRRASKVVRVE